MKKILLLFFSFITILASSQKKDVEFQVKKGNNRITFKGINNSEFDQEVTLYFKSISGLYGYSKPITKTIPAKKKINFMELRFNGKYSYNYYFNTKAIPTQQQKSDWNAKVASHNLTKDSQLDKGIIVFSKDGCSRCKLTVDYFIKNDVDFTLVNISESRDNNQLMWKTKMEERI